MGARHLVLGFGQVGQAIYMALRRQDAEWLDKNYETRPTGKFDILHVCIPIVEDFAAIVASIAQHYSCRIIMVHSTVYPKLMEEIRALFKGSIFNTPTSGTHDKIFAQMSHEPKLIGPCRIWNDKHMAEVIDVVKSMGLEPKVYKSYKETCISKLLETTFYGINIAFAQYAKRICDHEGASFDEAYTDSTLHKWIGRHYDPKKATSEIERIPRPVFFPGEIGGHCVMPNIKLLQEHVLFSSLLYGVESENEQVKNGCLCPACTEKIV